MSTTLLPIGTMIYYKGCEGNPNPDLGWVVSHQPDCKLTYCATASAYITTDERLWLTSGDVKVFHKELNEGAFISEYAFVSASYAEGEPIMVVQDVDTGKV